MEHEVETAVVILNWNGKSFLERFLPRLIECTPGPDTEIVVADNHSSDGSAEFMRRRYPGIRLIVNPENGGFAKGYNDALKQIKARFFVLLNSDIEVTPRWVEPIIAKMKKDPTVAAAQPKLRSYGCRGQFEYSGAAGGYIDRLGYPFCRGRIFDKVETDRGQYDSDTEIFWATGAALFVRADLYLGHGGLDEDFFAHMEEIDFCWRMKNLGYKIMYYPESVVYHIGGGTLPKGSSRKTYLNFRNNMALLYKNLPDKALKPVMQKRKWMDLLAALMFLAKGHTGDFKAVIKARKDFKEWKKRLQPERGKAPHPEKLSCMYGKSIVSAHYLHGISRFDQLSPHDFTPDAAAMQQGRPPVILPARPSEPEA